jgi:hypothetical protein
MIWLFGLSPIRRSTFLPLRSAISIVIGKTSQLNAAKRRQLKHAIYVDVSIQILAVERNVFVNHVASPDSYAAVRDYFFFDAFRAVRPRVCPCGLGSYSWSSSTIVAMRLIVEPEAVLGFFRALAAFDTRSGAGFCFLTHLCPSRTVTGDIQLLRCLL